MHPLFASQLQDPPMEIRIHSSFVGSSPCQHYRSDWAILQVTDTSGLFELIETVIIYSYF